MRKETGPDRPNSHNPTAKGTSPSENVRRKLLAGTTRTRHREVSRIRQITSSLSPMTYWQLSCRPTGIIPHWTWHYRPRRTHRLVRFPGNLVYDGRIHILQGLPNLLEGGGAQLVYPPTPGSIESFATLKAKFIAQFAMSKPHQMTSVALVNIRQEKGESLKSFMARFGQVALGIRGLLPEVAMAYLITALRPGPFADSLAMQPSANMDDLCRRATQFMQVEELRQYSRGEQGQGRRGDRSSNPHDSGTHPACRGSQSTHHSIPAGRASLRKL